MQLYDQSEDSTSFGSCCSIDDCTTRGGSRGDQHPPLHRQLARSSSTSRSSRTFVSEYAAGPHAAALRPLQQATSSSRRSPSGRAGFGADAVARPLRRVERDASGRVMLRRGVEKARISPTFSSR